MTIISYFQNLITKIPQTKNKITNIAQKGRNIYIIELNVKNVPFSYVPTNPSHNRYASRGKN
jgi:hypothetical protein